MKALLKKSLILTCISLFMSSVFAADALGNEERNIVVSKKGCQCKTKKNSHKNSKNKKDSKHSEEQENSIEQ